MFSVIIPTHNRANILIKCLECLSIQEFKSFEVLVIDDGSTDNTAEVCDKFNSHLNLKYIHLKKCSGGPALPRNIGIDNSKYDWIAFLDSDDIWSPDKLQVIADHISINPKIDFIFHEFHGVQSNFIIQPINLLDQLFLKGNIIVNSSVVVRKCILINLNGFDTNPKLISAEDYDLWIRIALETDKYIYLDEPLGTYSYTQDSLSLNYKMKLKNFQYLYYKHKYLYNKNIRFLFVFLKSYIKHLLLFYKKT
jgi:glycosyltransferase involved in cell wall biosynthesis